MKWLFLIVIALVALYRVFPLVNVCGCSMFPTYCDGEIILSRRLFSRKRIKVGDVYVFYHPTVKGRLLIKRVAKVYREKGVIKSVYFLGDNPDNSFDGRNFGYVFVDDIVAKVLFSRKRVTSYEED